MQENEKWIFYTDLFGRQRWQKISRQGETLAESSKAFHTLPLALADACAHGYVPSEDSDPWALEWRVEELRVTREAGCAEACAHGPAR